MYCDILDTINYNREKNWIKKCINEQETGNRKLSKSKIVQLNLPIKTIRIINVSRHIVDQLTVVFSGIKLVS